MRLTARARNLRKRATPEETLVWRWLRDRRFTGVKFRRQRPIGNYIADFYCAALKLVIEVDGRGHAAPAQEMYDVERDCELSKVGVTVLRVANEDIRENPTAASDRILRTIATLTRRFAPPSPASGRGR